MASAPAGERVTVTTYGFNIPCRRFLVTSNIARDRGLPVVDEFVLRALKIAERLPIDRLAAFLGLSMFEAGVVVEDLTDRSLVRASGDCIELAPAALEYFRSGREGTPEIVEVQTWVDRLWFDLISKNMMVPDRHKPFDHLFDLSPIAEAGEMPEDFARRALEQNFKEFLQNVRKIQNTDKFNLYSISEVLPDRFGYVALSGSMELQILPEPRLVPKLLEIGADERERYQPLSDALQDSVRRAREPDPSNGGFQEFRKMLGDTPMPSAHDGIQILDPTRWLGQDGSRLAAGRQPVLGTPYVGRNVEIFSRAIERGAERFITASPGRINLTWYRPGGTAWGASLDLQSTVQELSGAIRKSLSAAWQVETTLIVPANAKQDAKRKFSKIFDHGVLAPANYLPSCVEVVLLEGVAAMVLTRAAVSRTVTVPVGMVVSTEKDVKKIEGILNTDQIGGGMTELWKPQVRDDRTGRSSG